MAVLLHTADSSGHFKTLHGPLLCPQTGPIPSRPSTLGRGSGRAAPNGFPHPNLPPLRGKGYSVRGELVEPPLRLRPFSAMSTTYAHPSTGSGRADRLATHSFAVSLAARSWRAQPPAHGELRPKVESLDGIGPVEPRVETASNFVTARPAMGGGS